MSPATASMAAPPGFSRSRWSIASELSMPATRTPRSARGTATRPVPIANSRTRPPAASSASVSTVGPMTCGENMLHELSS